MPTKPRETVRAHFPEPRVEVHGRPHSKFWFPPISRAIFLLAPWRPSCSPDTVHFSCSPVNLKLMIKLGISAMASWGELGGSALETAKFLALLQPRIGQRQNQPPYPDAAHFQSWLESQPHAVIKPPATNRRHCGRVERGV